jgi:hypothetical protein
VSDANAAFIITATYVPGGVPSSGDDLPACEFYISTSGTGTAGAGGTFADPWNISMLRNSTAQGRYESNVVCLNDGTYCAPEDNTDSAVPYYSIAGGTDDNDRTVIRATNARLAILELQIGCSGSDYVSQAIIGTVATEPYVTIQNLTIREGSSKLIQILSSNVTVTGNHLYDLDNAREGGTLNDNTDAIRIEGLLGGRISGHLISNNVFHGFENNSGAWQSSSTNAAAVKLYHVNGAIIEYNLCYEAGSCWNEKINSAASIVRYNLCHTVNVCNNAVGSDSNNFGWDGTPSSFTAEIHHNIAVNVAIWHDTDAGGFAGPTGLAQVTNVYNNTVYGLSAISGNNNWWTTFRDGGDADLYHAKNNIYWLTGSAGGGLVHENTAGKAFSQIHEATTIRNWYPGTLRWLSGTYTTLANWQAACSCDANAATTNPNFASAGGTDPDDYVGSGTMLTAADDGGPVGAWDTGVTQIGPDWTL